MLHVTILGATRQSGQSADFRAHNFNRFAHCGPPADQQNQIILAALRTLRLGTIFVAVTIFAPRNFTHNGTLKMFKTNTKHVQNEHYELDSNIAFCKVR